MSFWCEARSLKGQSRTPIHSLNDINPSVRADARARFNRMEAAERLAAERAQQQQQQDEDDEEEGRGGLPDVDVVANNVIALEQRRVQRQAQREALMDEGEEGEGEQVDEEEVDEEPVPAPTKKVRGTKGAFGRK